MMKVAVGRSDTGRKYFIRITSSGGEEIYADCFVDEFGICFESADMINEMVEVEDK